jgi:hypothetical protein
MKELGVLETKWDSDPIQVSIQVARSLQDDA